MIVERKIKPVKDTVIIRLLNLEEIYEDLITQQQSDEGSIAVRYGEVISKGPDVNLPNSCSTLEVGDIAIFTQFAGHFIALNDDTSIYKALRGYDIIGKAMNKEDLTNEEALTPTGDRMLIRIESQTPNSSDDIIIGNASDNTMADLAYGTVISISPDVRHVKVKEGQTVAFPAYAGTTVRALESEDRKELKVIVEHDILFTA